jgi:hypothetical protein
MSQSNDPNASVEAVPFRYKKEVDPTRSLCFGLIAEEVAKMDPHL